MIETAEKSDHETGMAIIVVAAALRDSEGRILIQRRPAHKNHGGLWEFPGGNNNSHPCFMIGLFGGFNHSLRLWRNSDGSGTI